MLRYALMGAEVTLVVCKYHSLELLRDTNISFKSDLNYSICKCISYRKLLQRIVFVWRRCNHIHRDMRPGRAHSIRNMF